MNTMARVNVDPRRSLATAASLILAAWLVLAGWSLSPYREWLDHARMEEIGASLVVRLGVFALGWALMVIAMMLPGMLLVLRRCAGSESLSARRSLPLILPYVGVWTVFGCLSYWGDTLLHEMVEHAPVFAGMIAPGVLLLAGLYQFTPLKQFCLSKCRPEGGAFQNIRQPGRRSLWTAGFKHGAFCLGSCWALMLLMFALGGVSLIWMLLLSTVMAVERLSRWGGDIAQVLGAALVVGSVLLVLV